MSTGDGDAKKVPFLLHPDIATLDAAELQELGFRDGHLIFVMRRMSAKGKAVLGPDDAFRFTLPAPAADKMMAMLMKLHAGLQAKAPKFPRKP
jgi:hypothetical protein